MRFGVVPTECQRFEDLIAGFAVIVIHSAVAATMQEVRRVYFVDARDGASPPLPCSVIPWPQVFQSLPHFRLDGLVGKSLHDLVWPRVWRFL
jgi:hypothetical protein